MARNDVIACEVDAHRSSWALLLADCSRSNADAREQVDQVLPESSLVDCFPHIIRLRFYPFPDMHPFASYVLRSYYKATGWNEDNLYANLTRSSNGA